MHLGSGILPFSELLKRVICTEALWQSLKRELKQHTRKNWPLLLPGASVILFKNKGSSNINPPCWHNTVPLREGSWTPHPGSCVSPFSLCSRVRIPGPSRQRRPKSHPFHVQADLQLLVWIVRASPPRMGTPSSQPLFLAQPICLQYLPAPYISRKETSN